MTKLDIIADFIYLINDGVIIITNKLANMSDLLIIQKIHEKYQQYKFGQH